MTLRTSTALALSPSVTTTYICCGGTLNTLNTEVAVLPRCRSCGGTMKLIDRFDR
jgi:hypothetical protein